MSDANTVSEELNRGLAKNPSKTLHQRLAFSGRLGWFLFAVMVMAFVLQSIVFNFQPKPILTADPQTGDLNGTVLFNDVLVRDEAAITKDIKAWVSARLSLNSSTIFQDAQIALNHMCPELQTQVLDDWQTTAYLATIEASKGVAKVEFNDDGFVLQRDEVGSGFSAVVDGQYVIGLVKPQRTPFRIEIKGTLLPKTQNTSLGLEVCSYADV